MKKLLLITLTILTLSCSTESTVEETGWLPSRFKGNWLSDSSVGVPRHAQITVNKLLFEGTTETILQTSGEVTEDNGATLCRINFSNNEKVLLLISIYDPNTIEDDVIGISYYRDGVLVHNNFWTRQ